jgi:hypothetical protein
MSYHHNLQRSEHTLFLVFLACLDNPKLSTVIQWTSCLGLEALDNLCKRQALGKGDMFSHAPLLADHIHYSDGFPAAASASPDIRHHHDSVAKKSRQGLLSRSLLMIAYQQHR